MDEQKINEYKNSFYFGIKLTLLVVTLLLPISLAVLLGFLINSGLTQSPLYIRGLELESLFSFSEEGKLNNEIIRKIKTNPVIVSIPMEERVWHAKLNRKINGKEEEKLVVTKMLNVIDDLEEFKTINVDENGDERSGWVSHLYLWNPTYAYGKTLLYDHFSIFGNIVIFFTFFVLFILTVASYFPIFRAFINLFKKKRVF